MKIKMLIALLVIVISIIPLQNVSADGVQPFEVEFIYHPHNKGAKVEIQFAVVSSWIEGKLVEIRLVENGKTSVVNIKGMKKAPGKNMYYVPDAGFSSVAVKYYQQTENTQILLITIYDFLLDEPWTFAFHIPPA